jgi:predicted oxidoreductase (fatty acid repression mutant protein)
MSLENFESWALQSMAMLQNVLWNGLTYLKYGANIQHFNKELDEFTKQTFNLPSHWKLLSQMNIGTYSGQIPSRRRLPINHILTVVK